MSDDMKMDVSTESDSATKPKSSTSIANASQSQIAQKTWEIANFIQGKMHRNNNNNNNNNKRALFNYS
jgi:hypothetical protein